MRGIVGQQSCLIPNRPIPAVGGSDPVMTGVNARQPKQQQNDVLLPLGRHRSCKLPKLQRSRSMFNQDDLFSSEDK